MTMLYHKNDAVLYGRLSHNLTATANIGGAITYNTFITVRRDSGAEDHLPLSFPGHAAGSDPYRLRGQMVRVLGEMRSYNRSDADAGHRHRVTVWADDIQTTSEPYGQIVRMQGVICKPPYYRETPTREVCDLMIAVDAPGKESYIPVICWGMTARRMANAQVGDMVEMEGRFQSREYKKKLDVFAANGEKVCVTRTAYEISAKTCRVIGMVRRRLIAE